jgi:hypothetical protein
MMDEDRFVADRAGIYQITWGGWPPGTPEDVIREWTGELANAELEFFLGDR